MEYEFNIEKNKINKLTIAYIKIIMKYIHIYSNWIKLLYKMIKKRIKLGLII